jgi:uncharacterized protein
MVHPRLHKTMNVQVAGFEWDEGNRTKCQRHGVSNGEAEEQVLPDPRHSAKEPRLFVIGRTRRGRYCFVAFTLRRQGERVMIRPISVRYMHRREVARYAQEDS